MSALLPDPFGGAPSSPPRTARPGHPPPVCLAANRSLVRRGTGTRPVVVVNLTAPLLDRPDAYGPDGRIGAPRGVEVAGNAVCVSGGLPWRRPVTIAPAVRTAGSQPSCDSASWSGETSLAAIGSPPPPIRDRARDPGLAAGAGARRLVVANPNERTTTVTVGFLEASRPGVVAAPAVGGTRGDHPITTGLGGQAVALTRPLFNR